MFTWAKIQILGFLVSYLYIQLNGKNGHCEQIWWPVDSNNKILLTFSFIRLGEHGGDTTPGNCTDGNYYVSFLSGFKKQFLLISQVNGHEREKTRSKSCRY